MKKKRVKISSKRPKNQPKTAVKRTIAKKPARKEGLMPLGDRLLLREIESEEVVKTETGIYIPDSAKEDKTTKKGKVIAVGEGKYQDGKMVPLSVKVGDTVIYQWGEKMSFKDEEYVIIRESEILAVIR
jgi:chaperonin GroES